MISLSSSAPSGSQQLPASSELQIQNWTNKLQILEPKDWPTIPKYRVLNDNGSLGDSIDSSLSEDKLIDMFEGMVKLQVFDNIMFECHRQGRISFYMTNTGEEATQFGSVGALETGDLIFAQYRESGVLIYRKMPLEDLINQCLGNCQDSGKGRQMPVHYGSRALNHVTISSTLTTQLPQAVGAAYGFKGMGETDRVVICYFGDGAASEGDAHAALNFAATLECPVIFFCRNNGYAISTPTQDQYRGDGIVTRAIGYGMSGIRVDGNDLLAVYRATRTARDLAVKEQRPILIEAMTYRVGHHSTSDDSSAYRPTNEVKEWLGAENEPLSISRARKYLVDSGIYSFEREEKLRHSIRKEVLEALNRAEKRLKLPISSMFDDVYSQIPGNLMKQRDQLRLHLETYGENYPLHEYEKE